MLLFHEMIICRSIFLMSKLYLTRLRLSDSGNYSCQADAGGIASMSLIVIPGGIIQWSHIPFQHKLLAFLCHPKHFRQTFYLSPKLILLKTIGKEPAKLQQQEQKEKKTKSPVTPISQTSEPSEPELGNRAGTVSGDQGKTTGCHKNKM